MFCVKIFTRYSIAFQIINQNSCNAKTCLKSSRRNVKTIWMLYQKTFTKVRKKSGSRQKKNNEKKIFIKNFSSTRSALETATTPPLATVLSVFWHVVCRNFAILLQIVANRLNCSHHRVSL